MDKDTVFGQLNVNNLKTESESESEESVTSSNSIEIYSNDNENIDNNTSLIESLEDKLNNESNKDEELSNLLKNKLAELQYIASDLDINLRKTTDKGEKKKTKLELANEIYNKKYLNKI